MSLRSDSFSQNICDFVKLLIVEVCSRLDSLDVGMNHSQVSL